MTQNERTFLFKGYNAAKKELTYINSTKKGSEMKEIKQSSTRSLYLNTSEGMRIQGTKIESNAYVFSVQVIGSRNICTWSVRRLRTPTNGRRQHCTNIPIGTIFVSLDLLSSQQDKLHSIERKTLLPELYSFWGVSSLIHAGFVRFVRKQFFSIK